MLENKPWDNSLKKKKKRLFIEDVSIFPILGDGPIDVRDDDLVVPVPQVDGPGAAARSLVLSGYAEGHIIWPLSQLQTGLRETQSIFTNTA